MATREENLKKINDELELMSDEELDQVVGGECSETANDSRFLNSLNGSCDRYGEERIAWTFGVYSSEIEKAWATVGIKAEVYFANYPFDKKNTYTRMDNGQSLTQEQARQYAMKVTQHYMTEKDWKW